MTDLTETQRRVFEFVRDRLVAGQAAPTMREVAAKFRWGSKRAAECHIKAIIKKGWLAAEPGKARSLRLVDGIKAVRQAVIEQFPIQRVQLNEEPAELIYELHPSHCR